MKLVIDGHACQVSVTEAATILEVARRNGIYIPALCYHPSFHGPSIIRSSPIVYQGAIPQEGREDCSVAGCMLCWVEVEGVTEPVKACEHNALDGMVVRTHTDSLRSLRQRYLADLLAGHPHACLVCPDKEGCTRLECSQDVAEPERCCSKLGNCELEMVADYIRIPLRTRRYVYRELSVLDSTKPLLFDYNLCIGGACLRCVRGCHEIAQIGAMQFSIQDGKAIIGLNGPSVKESDCIACGLCTDICPTGALTDSVKRPKKKFPLLPVPLPPVGWERLSEAAISHVPQSSGVLLLADESQNLLLIQGTANLHLELRAYIGFDSTLVRKTRFFKVETEPMFTARESELIQQYSLKFEKLPEGNMGNGVC